MPPKVRRTRTNRTHCKSPKSKTTKYSKKTKKNGAIDDKEKDLVEENHNNSVNIENKEHSVKKPLTLDLFVNLNEKSVDHSFRVNENGSFTPTQSYRGYNSYHQQSGTQDNYYISMDQMRRSTQENFDLPDITSQLNQPYGNSNLHFNQPHGNSNLHYNQPHKSSRYRWNSHGSYYYHNKYNSPQNQMRQERQTPNWRKKAIGSHRTIWDSNERTRWDQKERMMWDQNERTELNQNEGTELDQNERTELDPKEETKLDIQENPQIENSQKRKSESPQKRKSESPQKRKSESPSKGKKSESPQKKRKSESPQKRKKNESGSKIKHEEQDLSIITPSASSTLKEDTEKEQVDLSDDLDFLSDLEEELTEAPTKKRKSSRGASKDPEKRKISLGASKDPEEKKSCLGASRDPEQRKSSCASKESELDLFMNGDGDLPYYMGMMTCRLLRQVKKKQLPIAIRLINEVLFQGQVDGLKSDSRIVLDPKPQKTSIYRS